MVWYRYYSDHAAQAKEERVTMATIFRYDPAIPERYPDIVGGVILARGITIARIGTTPLSQIPSLSAWRAAFRAFGLDPTQYRCAAEALLRRLTKAGSIPNLNALVDLGNLASIRYALPVAVFDLRAATGPITVRFADGTEHFTPLGQEAAEHPVPGEVIFCDDANLVSARRWCWRQSAESAARDDSTTVLITVEAQHPGGRTDVEAALHDLLALLHHSQDSEIHTAILNRDNPALEA
jgi:DNA/RNA-binding domain of Phe-tRNA-synthetase-like protein